MRCYNHHVRPAVGICKACGRGLCQQCAADLGRALACRSRCEDEALRLVDLADSTIDNHQRYQRAQTTHEQALKMAYLFAGAAGILLAVSSLTGRRISWAELGLGLLLVAFGLWGTLRETRQRPTQ